MNLIEKLRRNAERVDAYIMKLLEGEPEILYEASRYLLKAGGKRLRPYLVLRAVNSSEETSRKRSPSQQLWRCSTTSPSSTTT